MLLNEGQTIAKSRLISWWKGGRNYFILDGQPGVGKSTMLDSFLSSISARVLINAPMHEALKQVRQKTHNKYVYKTVAASLGMQPKETEHGTTFVFTKVPNFMDNFNLLVVEEAGLLNEECLAILLQTGIKTLFIGDDAQLPPVVVPRPIFDKCISPIFKRDFERYTLTEPMRNSGKVWEFICELRKNVYSDSSFIPKDYDIIKPDLTSYIHSSQGIQDFSEEKTKIILWTNDNVDRYNVKLRQVIFGKELADNNKYLPGDKIILKAQYAKIEGLESLSLQNVLEQNTKNLDVIYSNTRAEVIQYEKVIVALDKRLILPAYKIQVKCEGETVDLYELQNSQDMKKIKDFFMYLVYNTKANKKEGIFKDFAFIRSCFAELKFNYCGTAHSYQGSSIENVIVILSDMQKNMNIVERNKCIYTGASRVQKNLMIYRGG